MRRGLALTEVVVVLFAILVIVNVALLYRQCARPHSVSYEAMAIGDLRTIASAEAAYSSAADGAYGSLECLGTPSSAGCIVGYGPSAPTFLDATLADIGRYPVRGNYRRSFTPGTPAPTRSAPKGVSGYCYEATPSAPGRTGVRSFAIDASGRLCQDRTGGRICGKGVKPGELPATCEIVY